MNKKMSRVCALVLSLSFVLSSGCKKKNKDKRQRVVQESDPYYSCEEVLLDLEVPEAEGKELKYRSISDIPFQTKAAYRESRGGNRKLLPAVSS